MIQTAESLAEAGFVVSCAKTSRLLDSERAGLEWPSASGIGIVTAEMVIFEWPGRAGTSALKEQIPPIK